MKNLILTSCLIACCSLFTGCLGLVVAHPHQKSTENFCLGKRGEVTETNYPTALTQAQVVESWGRPDSERDEADGFTVWSYRGKMDWLVVCPMYLLPVPLPFPRGHSNVDIYFWNGVTQKASIPVVVYTGIAMVPMADPPFLIGWEREVDSPEPRIKGVADNSQPP